MNSIAAELDEKIFSTLPLQSIRLLTLCRFLQ
jgi:hypothetical protein